MCASVCGRWEAGALAFTDWACMSAVFGPAQHEARMRRSQFAYMTLALCRHYAPNLEASFKVYVFNLEIDR